MIPARVVARITGAVKHETYDGRPLYALRSLRRGGLLGGSFLAIDLVGSGVGDDVLVSRPPGLAREVLGRRAPIRSLIVGILDEPPP